VILTAEDVIGPGNNLYLSPGVSVKSSGGHLTLRAGDRLTLAAGCLVQTQAAGLVTLSMGFNDVDALGSAVIAGTLAGNAVSLSGGSAGDSLLLDYTAGASLPDGLSYDGSFGQNSLTLSDAGSAGPHAYTMTSASLIRDLDLPLTLTQVEVITVTGGVAADTFGVGPDAVSSFHVVGGQPNTSPGDTLWILPAGQTAAQLALTGQDATGLSGSWTFANRQPVSFTGIDTLANLANKLWLPLVVK